MNEWDFRADVEQLLAMIGQDRGPRTMSDMGHMAAVLVQRGRSDDPAGLERWFNENAEILVGQQILVATVHAQRPPPSELPRLVREWAGRSQDRTPAAAVEWLKEEHPGLLRAWLLSRVEDPVASEMTSALWLP